MHAAFGPSFRYSSDRRALGGSQTKRLTKAGAVSAPWGEPLSIVSACPRLGISTISVTAVLPFCCLKDALAIDHGTVLSFSPETIRSGPRAGFSVSTPASVQG